MRRVVQSGSMAEQDVLPPDRGAHALGPVDFGLFEESWRQTLAFSTGATHRGVGLPVAKRDRRTRKTPRLCSVTRTGLEVGLVLECAALSSHTPPYYQSCAYMCS